jgi:hypothetical protein
MSKKKEKRKDQEKMEIKCVKEIQKGQNKGKKGA